MTDNNGCTATASITVNSPNALMLSVGSTSLTCYGDSTGTATVNVSGGTNPYNYNWSNGTSQQAITNLTVGNYTVMVTDNNGCIATTTINVASNPGPLANAGVDVTIALGKSTILSANGGNSYNWTPVTGLSSATIANPVASPTITTTYCVEVSDANGCTDSACVTVTVELPCGDIYIPTAFSPNDDNHNDLECVIGYCIKTLKLTIYNRLGEIVFETTDPAICWDGKFTEVEMNTGFFVYYLNAVLTDDQQITKKGNISLFR